jgi:ATP-dependent helicase/DNAse subunit B
MLGDLDKTDAAEEAGFRAILDYTRRKLGGLADGMLDGRVPVSPCRMADYNACRWCTLKPVCRVEPGLTKLRYLERMRRTEALRRLSDEPAEP